MAKKQLTIEEKLQAALVPAEEQPYKVPENWCWTRLGNVAQWGSGGTPSRKNPSFYEGDIPWIKTGELNEEYIYDTEEHISKEALEKSSAKIFPVNTVVLAMYGATIGKVGILGVPATTNQACACGVCSKGIKFAFLAKFLQSQKQSFIMKGKGGAQPNISQQIIKNHPIALPPLAEQSRIVARIESLFAKLGEAKEKIQEVLDGADLRRAAILHQAFTGKLTEKWRRENGVSNESWEDKSIKEISIPRAGVAFDSKKFSTKGYQVIRMGNLYNGELDLSRNPVYYPREFLDNKILERALIHNDDILITLTGTKYKRDYGYAVKMVNPEKLLVNQRILCLTAIKEYVLSDYLNYYLQTKLFRDVFFSNETGGVNQGNVSSKFVESIVIKVPLVDEQQEIVRLLDNLLSREQSTVTACEEALTTIDTLKKSILARAFRGELGTNDPSEVSAKELLQEILAS